MYPNMTIGRPHFGPGYVPYFYAAGQFTLYDLPRPQAPLDMRFASAASYDFTSDLTGRHGYPVPQTVERVIRRGYLAIPESEPETALISDKKHTARLGLEQNRDSLPETPEPSSRRYLPFANCRVSRCHMYPSGELTTVCAGFRLPQQINRIGFLD